MMEKNDLHNLLQAYVHDRLDEAGRRQLAVLLDQPEIRQECEETIQQQLQSRLYEAEDELIDVFQRIEVPVMQYVQHTTQRVAPAKRVLLWHRQFFKYAAAILLLAGITVAIALYINQQSKQPSLADHNHLINPGTNRAVLTINNNQPINLAANKTGININNTITYNDGEKIADAGQWLQLTTPRGGQYQAVLPDGSKVWLNAASSIKFPSKFDDKERRVEVNGEAYFEIEKDVKRPFKVSGGNQEIEVLGTSFNINIYNDEPIKKTTLITGSIKITSNNQTAILRPGEQANIPITPITKIKQITVQTADVIAWKNGYFSFEKMTLQEIVKQIERWYDIKIILEGNIADLEMGGKMDRGVTLSEIIHVFNNYGFKTQLDGRVLTIATH